MSNATFTCGHCLFFQIPEGYQNIGKCYGAPPVMTGSGKTLPVPDVPARRPACALFRPLTDGMTNVIRKRDPDTPAQARAARHGA